MRSDPTPASICLPGLEAGTTPSASPTGPPISPSGPSPVPASRSAGQAKLRRWATSGTYGPLFIGSSPSAVLQSWLASRLRAVLAGNGSPEYGLTWKDWDMLSGPPICALRALARRTSGNAYGGWPSPNAMPPNRGGLQTNPENALERRAQGHMLNLDDAAVLAGWPTPKVASGDYQYQGGDHSKIALNLSGAAKMAGWNSPRATDGSHGGPNQAGGALPNDAAKAGWATPTGTERSGQGPSNVSLMQQAKRAGWATPTANVKDQPATKRGLETLGGQALTTGSPALTGKRGALNPDLSRWLMGFPPEWGNCAPTAMPSCRSWQRRS